MVHDGPTSDIMLCVIALVPGAVVVQSFSPGRTMNPSGCEGDPSPVLEMVREESFFTHRVYVALEAAWRSTGASACSAPPQAESANMLKRATGAMRNFTTKWWHSDASSRRSRSRPL